MLLGVFSSSLTVHVTVLASLLIAINWMVEDEPLTAPDHWNVHDPFEQVALHVRLALLFSWIKDCSGLGVILTFDTSPEKECIQI